jgi:hypothetical protein
LKNEKIVSDLCLRIGSAAFLTFKDRNHSE